MCTCVYIVDLLFMAALVLTLTNPVCTLCGRVVARVSILSCYGVGLIPVGGYYRRRQGSRCQNSYLWYWRQLACPFWFHITCMMILVSVHQIFIHHTCIIQQHTTHSEKHTQRTQLLHCSSVLQEIIWSRSCYCCDIVHHLNKASHKHNNNNNNTHFMISNICVKHIR